MVTPARFDCVHFSLTPSKGARFRSKKQIALQGFYPGTYDNAYSSLGDRSVFELRSTLMFSKEKILALWLFIYTIFSIFKIYFSSKVLFIRIKVSYDSSTISTGHGLKHILGWYPVGGGWESDEQDFSLSFMAIMDSNGQSWVVHSSSMKEETYNFVFMNLGFGAYIQTYSILPHQRPALE